MTQVIEVARHFSRTPGQRFRRLGPFSGEEFREGLLTTALRASDEPVEVVLDDTAGYGSSFLEEAFGGLVRAQVASPAELLRRIHITARSELYRSYAEEARDYLEEAARLASKQ